MKTDKNILFFFSSPKNRNFGSRFGRTKMSTLKKILIVVLFATGETFGLDYSSDKGTISFGGKGVFGTIFDGGKEAGGDELHFNDVYFNGVVGFTTTIDDGCRLGLKWDFIVPKSILIDGNPGSNRIRAEGYLARPEHLIRGYLQTIHGKNLYEVSVGQDLYAGFKPLIEITDYFAALPPLFLLSRQFDQGVEFRWERFSRNGKSIGEISAAVINGDGGFGMAGTSTRAFHNSYPAYAITGKIQPFSSKTFGDFGLSFSLAIIERGSNPGAKRYGDHLLVAVNWLKKFWEKELEIRVSKGELKRGFTEKPAEITQGMVIEAAIRDIEFGSGLLTPYLYYSNLSRSSGDQPEIWLDFQTNYQNQWGFGVKWDQPFSWKYVSFSGGVILREIDGWDRWGILDTSNIFFFNVAVQIP